MTYRTPEELIALGNAAKRARTLALRQMLHACVLTVKALAARFASITGGKRVSPA